MKETNKATLEYLLFQLFKEREAPQTGKCKESVTLLWEVAPSSQLAGKPFL
jgi:hypothetical protein